MRFKVSHFRSLIQSYERHERREALVQPEVIPPLHGHEVAKPHVRELMEVSACESKTLGERWNLSSHEIVLVIGDQANILHGAEVVLWDEDLVILVEGVGLTEEY
jgi:hypothetical protein